MFIISLNLPLSISETFLLCHLGPSLARAHVAVEYTCYGILENERTE